jgi:hypothetical protein
MLKDKSLTLTALLTLGAFVAAYATYAAADETKIEAAPSPKAVELRLAERKLWSEHVVWTRQYVVAAVAGGADADAAAGRLMRNQEDLGNAIVPYYGANAGKALTALLNDHIKIAVDLVAAAKEGDDAKIEAAGARWRGNAREIATFLAAANPAWKKDMLVDMFDEHLKLTTAEVVARLQKDWAGDIAAFDKIFDQALGMGDSICDGIVQQFPAKF